MSSRTAISPNEVRYAIVFAVAAVVGLLNPEIEPALVAYVALVAVDAVVALLAVVALVAVAALPEMLMLHVPDAPLPVVDGTDRLERAVPASVAPVPPLAIAIVPVTLAALPVMLPLIFEPASDVIHVGLEYDPPVLTPSVML